MGTRKPADPPAHVADGTAIRTVHGKAELNNRALVTLLRELNITLWSLDKTQFFRMQPILEDLKAMSMHLNFTFAMRRANLGRCTLAMAVKRHSNPTFQTVVRILYGMGLRLRVEPDPTLSIVVHDRHVPRRVGFGYKRNPTWTRRNALADGVPLEEAEAEAAKLRKKPRRKP